MEVPIKFIAKTINHDLITAYLIVEVEQLKDSDNDTSMMMS